MPVVRAVLSIAAGTKWEQNKERTSAPKSMYLASQTSPDSKITMHIWVASWLYKVVINYKSHSCLPYFSQSYYINMNCKYYFTQISQSVPTVCLGTLHPSRYYKFWILFKWVYKSHLTNHPTGLLSHWNLFDIAPWHSTQSCVLVPLHF